jgi:hypothetical protein
MDVIKPTIWSLKYTQYTGTRTRQLGGALTFPSRVRHMLLKAPHYQKRGFMHYICSLYRYIYVYARQTIWRKPTDLLDVKGSVWKPWKLSDETAKPIRIMTFFASWFFWVFFLPCFLLRGKTLQPSPVVISGLYTSKGRAK